jgi:hypothetical protein
MITKERDHVKEENAELKTWNQNLEAKYESACLKNIDRIAAVKRKSSIGCKPKDSMQELCNSV